MNAQQEGDQRDASSMLRKNAESKELRGNEPCSV